MPGMNLSGYLEAVGRIQTSEAGRSQKSVVGSEVVGNELYMHIGIHVPLHEVDHDGHLVGGPGECGGRRLDQMLLLLGGGLGLGLGLG